jgi:dTDP-4-dehydrorhamnose reductase
MSDLDFLVLGNTGQVGWELERQLKPLGTVKGIDFPEIDLTKHQSLAKLVRQLRPRVVFNAAAYTAVDKAESEPDLAMAINGVAPGVLAEEASRIGALLVHYSTDYVFDGTKGTPYLETDLPNPLNTYGRTKLAGDRAVAEVGRDYFIFRTSWVYGARGRNFLLTILKLAKDRKELRIVSDQIGAPTWCRHIAASTIQVLRNSKWCKHGGCDGTEPVSGLYNLTSSGSTSWAGFTEAILRHAAELGIPNVQASTVCPIKSEEYPTQAARPKYSLLDTANLQEMIRERMPDWQESLTAVMEEIKRLYASSDHLDRVQQTTSST